MKFPLAFAAMALLLAASPATVLAQPAAAWSSTREAEPVRHWLKPAQARSVFRHSGLALSKSAQRVEKSLRSPGFVRPVDGVRWRRMP